MIMGRIKENKLWFKIQKNIKVNNNIEEKEIKQVEENNDMK